MNEALQRRLAVFDEVKYIPAGKFRRYHDQGVLAHVLDVRSFVLNVRDLGRFLAGIGKAWRILKHIRPAVVLSKGGFVAVPVGIAAYLCRIPIVTHDSDAAAGLANRIVGRFAIIHATGLPAENYDYPPESIHYVGVPVDERIKPVTSAIQANFKKELDIEPELPVLLVGGAGHGARDVNNMVLEIAPKLLEKFPKLQIIHLSGKRHRTALAGRYQQQLGDLSTRVRVIGFTADFYKYTGAADLIITRAGATTIAELAAQRKAVILIPAPQLTGGHQLKNAQILKKQKAVETVANNDHKQLLNVAVGLLSEPPKRRALADRLGLMAKPDAARRLAELLLKVAKQNKSPKSK